MGVIPAGVSQGSLLSPELFGIFVRDLPKTPNTKLALYADYTAMLDISVEPRLAMSYLQTAIKELKDWFQNWRITVNVEKCAAI